MSPELVSHVSACCDARLDDKDRSDLNVSGFDFSILIPIVIQVLTELLSNCFSKAEPSEVASVLARGNDDSRVRAACFRAVTRATDARISSRKSYKLALGLGDACETATDAQRLEFVGEVKAATDWAM